MELVKNGLQSVVDEMSFTLERTCASQLIKEAQDYFTALCDARGNLIAISVTQPNALGVIPSILSHVVKEFGGTEQPGDVYIVNDPYHGGTHLNDIHIMKPIFYESVLVGYATTKAHHTDVGGRVPGSMAFDNTEIYQEGLRLSPLKLYDRGQPNQTLMKILELNVRFPDIMLADINAQVTALAIGEAGLQALAKEHGAELLTAYLDALLDYAESLARSQIASWPDGTAEFEDYCDDDGVTGQPVVFHVKATIRGDEVYVDFAGSSPQVAAAINYPPGEVISTVYLVVRCALTGDLPNNSGLFRPIHVSIPSGSVLNPDPPAPCSQRGLILYRVGEAVFGAFAQFVPDGVTAASEGGSYSMRCGGQTASGGQFLSVDIVQGSWGARADRDGIDGAANIQVNHTNTPIEVMEANFPVRMEHYEFVPDTGGAGRFRGGLAIERAWRYLSAREGFMRCRSDRRRFQPYGLYGGERGAPSRLTLEQGGGPPESVPSKAVLTLKQGDLVRLAFAGAGGWGDPLERDPLHVLEDVLEGKVSLEHAHERYGVIIDQQSMTVDNAATLRLRAAEGGEA